MSDHKHVPVYPPAHVPDGCIAVNLSQGQANYMRSLAMLGVEMDGRTAYIDERVVGTLLKALDTDDTFQAKAAAKRIRLHTQDDDDHDDHDDHEDYPRIVK